LTQQLFNNINAVLEFHTVFIKERSECLRIV
jgi:hypothetical protein